MPKPTILLIHGAFGDASSWRPVFDHLDGDEYTVLAPPSPLRGVAADAAYTAAVIDQLEAPVVLVGHSYSGSVITAAGASDKVAGLVYVAGFARIARWSKPARAGRHQSGGSHTASASESVSAANIRSAEGLMTRTAVSVRLIAGAPVALVSETCSSLGAVHERARPVGDEAVHRGTHRVDQHGLRSSPTVLGRVGWRHDRDRRRARNGHAAGYRR